MEEMWQIDDIETVKELQMYLKDIIVRRMCLGIDENHDYIQHLLDCITFCIDSLPQQMSKRVITLDSYNLTGFHKMDITVQHSHYNIDYFICSHQLHEWLDHIVAISRVLSARRVCLWEYLFQVYKCLLGTEQCPQEVCRHIFSFVLSISSYGQIILHHQHINTLYKKLIKKRTDYNDLLDVIEFLSL